MKELNFSHDLVYSLQPHVHVAVVEAASSVSSESGRGMSVPVTSIVMDAVQSGHHEYEFICCTSASRHEMVLHATLRYYTVLSYSRHKTQI